jgi:hypothetical protein
MAVKTGTVVKSITMNHMIFKNIVAGAIMSAGVFYGGFSNAQVLGGSGAQAKGMDMQTNPGGFVTQLPPAAPETKGDSYLQANWSLGDLVIGDKVLPGQLVRYNIDKDLFEIKNDQGQVKALEGRRVSAFKWINGTSSASESFVSARQFKESGVPVVGFLQQIAEGKYSLYLQTSLKLLKAHYVPELAAGDNTNRMVKVPNYLFAVDGRVIRVTTKKAFIENFENKDKLSSFIKEQKINLKDREDLLKIYDFLNTGV